MANNTTPYGATGGVSIISYLQKQRDGVVFQETFENVNFLQADGWSVLRGSPANSQAQAVSGISSWDNTAGNQSMPIAQKVITDTNVDSGQWLAQCWFYDPLTTSGGLYTTSAYPGPYFKVNLADGKYMQVGVRNSVSTSSYCWSNISSGIFTQDSFISSTVPRTNGWHLFQMFATNLFSTSCLYQVSIDNNSSSSNYVSTSSFFKASVISSLFVNAGTSADSGSSFGYFDNVGYYRNFHLNYVAPLQATGYFGSGVGFYNSSNSEIDLLNGISGSFSLALIPSGIGQIITFPFSLYIENTQQQPISGPSNLLYRSPLLQVNPGDIYVLQTINFGRKVTTYDPFIKELQSVSQSTAGVRETNNYGIKSPITFSVNSLTGWSWKQAADNFFLNAVQGNPFGLMVDNVSDNAFGVIGTSAFGGETNTVQIMQSVAGNVPNNVTTQFTVGNYYYVRNNANTQKQLVNLVSMTTSTLTFDQNLNFNVNPVDYVYSLQYYPFLEVAGDTQAFKCDDPMIPRFKWTQNCVDYNNG